MRIEKNKDDFGRILGWKVTGQNNGQKYPKSTLFVY